MQFQVLLMGFFTNKHNLHMCSHISTTTILVGLYCFAYYNVFIVSFINRVFVSLYYFSLCKMFMLFHLLLLSSFHSLHNLNHQRQLVGMVGGMWEHIHIPCPMMIVIIVWKREAQDSNSSSVSSSVQPLNSIDIGNPLLQYHLKNSLCLLTFWFFMYSIQVCNPCILSKMDDN